MTMIQPEYILQCNALQGAVFLLEHVQCDELAFHALTVHLTDGYFFSEKNEFPSKSELAQLI